MAVSCPLERYIRQNSASYFHIDCSRLAFIRDTGFTLRSLVKGQLVHRTDYRRLLLGRKGTGKSTLLDVISEAARSVYENNLIVCSTHYMNMSLAELPSTLIATAANIQRGENGSIRIQELERCLSKVNKFVLFIADELDSVFLSSGNAVDSKQIIGEIAEIGNTSNGRIHCIISGSSNQLRQLCFGKLPQEDKSRFPTYDGINLNSTKFSARWIHSFLDKNDFDAAVRLLQKNGATLTEFAKNVIYIQTGGNARHMAGMVNQDPETMTLDTYSLSIKDVNVSKEDLGLLQAVFKCVVSFTPAQETEFDQVVNWTRFIPLSSVQHEHGAALDIKKLYNLVDRGMLRFMDVINASGSGQEVSLGTPLVYLMLNNIDNDYLTTTEYIALRCPQFPCLTQTAKQVAVKYLVQNAANWIISDPVNFNLKHMECNCLAFTANHNVDAVELKNISKGDLVDCFWKELPDEYGAGLVFHQADGDTLIAHRIQLKLGMSKITESDATSIVNEFHTNMDRIRQFYADCNLPLSQQKFYLVTTRILPPEVKTILQVGPPAENGNQDSPPVPPIVENFITIIDAAALRKKVWPDFVKRLGRPYR